jgi:hypothetical protein
LIEEDRVSTTDPVEIPVTENEANEKKPWFTPTATIEQVSEVTKIALGVGLDGPGNCHS